MVTSNKLPEKKVVKMAGQSNSAVVPQRTLLGEVNEHITCPLCRGYYIDATTIVECLHSFCRSCIIKHLQVKSYCPVCEMMINSAKPNIKLDKALQDIVYKLVPGLFQKEMERRQQFYASRPGPAASATPEQRGEDTERIIFSPEDVISFSLEYADITDSDSISSKSSDSNEPQPNSATTRRFLQCPAVVNINHLKKFLSMKFDIDSSQFAIDILYKRVPLPDYYTLMDIAYIYNWKRNEPMRFFYQIIDYIAIRNRLFDINRKGSHFRDRKSSPISTEDTNISSPANNLNDQVSEGSSGADSPRPDDNSLKQTGEMTKNVDKPLQPNKEELHNEDGLNKNSKCNNICALSVKKNDNEVEKSQFLNSFELTAKNNCVTKASPTKMTNPDNNCVAPQTVTPAPSVTPKVEETLKRKNQTPLKTPELKKLKIEIDKPKIPNVPSDNISAATLVSNNVTVKGLENPHKGKASETITKSTQGPAVVDSLSTPLPSKEIKPQNMLPPKPQVPDSPGSKRPVQGLASNAFSPKRKPATDVPTSSATSSIQKTVSPLKLQIPKLDPPTTSVKSSELSKGHIKKMPELKPSILGSQPLQNKPQPINKVRMDLFANNSDPTMDRSMILSQVKTSLNIQNNGQSTGDPLKSIFDSCNINIPSSLSITLTDQKIDNRNPSEHVSDQKKNIVNKNLATSSTSSHKVPSPPVHNYIEILKLPDTDSKKQNKSESNSDGKSNTPNKSEASSQSKVANKSEGSAKGPVPNLKPISDTKLSKQSILSTQTGNFSAPITFQQTFEQQLQSLHSDKKQKINKSKTQVPKLVPAPKVFNVVSKSCSISNKPNPSSSMSEPKPSSALDLSTPHNVQNQTGVKQTFDKALETMQSIANLANKQNLPSKGLPIAMSQNNTYASISNRPMNPGVNNTLRLPSVNTIAQMKLDKPSTIVSNMSKQEPIKNHPNKTPNSGPLLSSVSYQLPSHNSPSATQPSPRSQTRSPSSSPKLVIAEEKQINNSIDPSINQILNSAISTLANASKSESTKLLPGPSKPGLKPGKPMTPANKPAIRPSMTLNPPMNPSAEYLSRPQLMPSHHHFYSQVDVNAWLKVQRQFDFFKSMSNIAHQSQNDFNNKDKQK